MSTYTPSQCARAVAYVYCIILCLVVKRNENKKVGWIRTGRSNTITPALGPLDLNVFLSWSILVPNRTNVDLRRTRFRAGDQNVFLSWTVLVPNRTNVDLRRTRFRAGDQNVFLSWSRIGPMWTEDGPGLGPGLKRFPFLVHFGPESDQCGPGTDQV